MGHFFLSADFFNREPGLDKIVDIHRLFICKEVISANKISDHYEQKWPDIFSKSFYSRWNKALFYKDILGSHAGW